MSAHSENGHGSHGTKDQLMMGFWLAVVLTVVPFAFVMGEPDMSRGTLIAIIMACAAVQIIVHLVYFLHLSHKNEEGWTLSSTLLAIIILFIVLAGSLWVMHNMNENMMPMPDMDQMMNLQSQQG